MGITKLPKPTTATGRVVEEVVRKVRPRSAVGKIGVAVGAEIGGALGDGAHRVVVSMVRSRSGAAGGPKDETSGDQAEEPRSKHWAEYVEQARREQREARRRVEEAFRQAQAGWQEGSRAADDRTGSYPGGGPRSRTSGAGALPCRYCGKAVADYYEVLEVSPRARQAVIEKAYRALMRECHPDLGGDARKAQLINEAYEVLRDPAQRRRFDQENGLT